MSDLSAVQVGEFLAVYSGGGWYGLEISKQQVTKATKAKVIAGTYTFNRRGYIRGGSVWDRTSAEPWDESKHPAELARKREEHSQRVRCNKLKELNWQRVPTDTVKQVYELVKAHLA